MKWFNPQCEPFRISGFPFYEQDRVYRRMPLNTAEALPEAVYGLAEETAGGQIRFHAKLKDLAIQVSLAAKPAFFANIKSPHLAVTSKSAFDLYLSKDGKDYVFYNVAKGMNETDRFYTHKFVDFQEAEEVDVLLNFPLYGGVDKILIGVDDEAEISAPHYQFRTNKKIAIYGGSIEQGACASRPGMCFTNMLSRWLDTEFYDFGFNSSGKGEPEVAKAIAGVPDLSALIITMEGNCPDGAWLEEKLREFIKIFRKEYPVAPVIVMPFFFSGQDMLHPWWHSQREEKLTAQEKVVAERKTAGDENIYLFYKNDTLPQSVMDHSVWHEATVDGLHCTDLGYYWVAEKLAAFLKELGL